MDKLRMAFLPSIERERLRLRSKIVFIVIIVFFPSFLSGDPGIARYIAMESDFKAIKIAIKSYSGVNGEPPESLSLLVQDGYLSGQWTRGGRLIYTNTPARKI